MKTNFLPNTLAQNANAVAAYLPNGQVFAARNISGTNQNAFFSAVAQEFTRVQNKIYELSYEIDPTLTVNLIDEWEAEVLIPDTCMTNLNKTLDQRRDQVIAKYAMMNITNELEWINLAAFFGYRIAIERGATYSVFPMKFPITFSNSEKQSRFTMVLIFVGLPKPSNIFGVTFPVKFSEDSNFLRCLFWHLKPANVLLQYRWSRIL